MISFIFSQLYDLCSNNLINHNDHHICLKSLGCCFTSIKMKSNELNSCFKMYKQDSDSTCKHFRNITEKYGNELSFCKCREFE